MEKSKPSRVIERRDAYRSKWLGIKFVDYEIGGERMNNYEMVFRPTSEDKNLPIDGVDILPIIKHKDKPSQVVLIANFRPPVGKFVLEFPAGLLEKDHTFEENARKEVKEETGYTVSHFVEMPSPTYYSDPWKSNETTKLYVAIIDNEKAPEQELEREQNIVVHLLIFDSTLAQQLQDLRKEHDYEIEAKLWTLAVGMSLSTLKL